MLVKPEVDTQIIGMVNKEEDRLLLRSEINSLVKCSQLEKCPFNTGKCKSNEEKHRRSREGVWR